MATYFRTDDEGGRHATSLGKPTPAHAQTKAAKRARKSVRATGDANRTRLTRADVEAAYVHPAPEVEARLVEVTEYFVTPTAGVRSLIKLALDNGHRVKATYNRGTTNPKWHVNAPDNKTNPGPPVDASQYHGEVVDCETVYVMKRCDCVPGCYVRIRGVWLNGKLDHIEIDGQLVTLKAAREVLS